MAERMTSESCRVVRFRWYTVLWPEESAETINQSVSGSQVNNMTSRTLVCTIKPKFMLIDLLLIHIIISQCKNDGIVLWLAGAVLI